jgi:hypothetical protein
VGISRRHPLEDNPFVDDFLEWMGSPEGQEFIEISDILEPLMRDVRLDAGERKFIWSDGRCVNFDQSVSVIQAQYPDFSLDDVRGFLICWIENYAEDGMTQEELDKLDDLADEWTDELRGKYI